MKKLILISACIIASSGTWAQNTNVHHANAKKNKAAEALVDQAKSSEEFHAYINAAQEEITLNDKRIAALLSKLVGQKNGESKKLPREVQRLVKTVVILERYNEELRAELETYITYGDGDWHLFRKEFNRDLSELSSGISDLRKRIYDDFIAQALQQ